MASIKFTLSLLFLCTVALGQTANVWDQLSRCENTCSSRCQKLVTDLKQKLEQVDESCNGSQPVDQTLYKDAYAFASSSSGLWLSAEPARAFADMIVALPNARVQFTAYKDAYSFASSSSGLWLSSEPARAFALKISSLRNADEVLVCYKEAYSFASSSSGLWLSAEPARKHAEKTCKIP